MPSQSERESFTLFWRAGSPFSQWYSAEFHVQGITFNCAEQYMMYSKAMLFDDEVVARKILSATSPGRQKALGREIQGFEESKWRRERFGIVYTGSYAKFSQNPHLRKKLLATGSSIMVEASPADRIWGVGLSASDPDIWDKSKWRGQNLLGEVLMKVRGELAEGGEPLDNTDYDRLAESIRSELPKGPRLVVIGSASFWHVDSEPLCEEVGQLLESVSDLTLITGGVEGVGATIGKSFFRHARQHQRSASVFHVLPQLARAPNYGTTFFAGEDMAERREVLARLGPLLLAVEGGPGTAHEACVAVDHGAIILPVGRSGGVADHLYTQMSCPAWADKDAWRELGCELTEVRKVASAVHRLIVSAIRHINWA